MSWGGSVQTMISSLKNNARKKRSTFFDGAGLGAKTEEEKHPWLEKEASPEKLAEIRKQVAERKRSALIRNAMLMLLSLILLFLLVALVDVLYGEAIKAYLSD